MCNLLFDERKKGPFNEDFLSVVIMEFLLNFNLWTKTSLIKSFLKTFLDKVFTFQIKNNTKILLTKLYFIKFFLKRRLKQSSLGLPKNLQIHLRKIGAVSQGVPAEKIMLFKLKQVYQMSKNFH